MTVVTTVVKGLRPSAPGGALRSGATGSQARCRPTLFRHVALRVSLRDGLRMRSWAWAIPGKDGWRRPTWAWGPKMRWDDYLALPAAERPLKAKLVPRGVVGIRACTTPTARNAIGRLRSARLATSPHG